MAENILIPPPLRRGDKIAIVAPATEVKPEFVTGAAEKLRNEGYVVEIAPHCLNAVSGTYSAPVRERLNDLLAALEDPEVRCILCARGGYGCVQFISEIPGAVLRTHPKWIVGFSDVSALHALMLSHGIASLHAGMAKHIHELGMEDASVREALAIMRGETDIISYSFSRENDKICPLITGNARGTLKGGNFAVLNGLASTPFDILDITPGQDVILFLEDIGESIYEVDRMLWRLHLSGALHRARGLIFGSFSSYKPDKNHPDMEQMIAQRLNEWGISVPVVLRFPVGHEEGRNFPLVEGCSATLTVSEDMTELYQILK